MTVTATRPQAYQSLGPEATSLHKAYLAARADWKLARIDATRAWDAYLAGRTPRESYESAADKQLAAYHAMRDAQTAAAHCRRDV